jgi:hypothetical protein
MQGLVDNYLSPNSPDIGECIYCGERDAPLSTEHAVPYALNGPWTLLRASCKRCADITTGFERDVTLTAARPERPRDADASEEQTLHDAPARDSP